MHGWGSWDGVSHSHRKSSARGRFDRPTARGFRLQGQGVCGLSRCVLIVAVFWMQKCDKTEFLRSAPGVRSGPGRHWVSPALSGSGEARAGGIEIRGDWSPSCSTIDRRRRTFAQSLQRAVNSALSDSCEFGRLPRRESYLSQNAATVNWSVVHPS